MLSEEKESNLWKIHGATRRGVLGFAYEFLLEATGRRAAKRLGPIHSALGSDYFDPAERARIDAILAAHET
jgi:hypothetical protein